MHNRFDTNLQGERGFEDLTGVDYCEGAIELARQCTKMKGVAVKLLVSVLLLDIGKIGFRTPTVL